MSIHTPIQQRRSYHLTDIKCDAAAKYRDTTGIDAQAFKLVLGNCDLSTLQGLRDYTMLRLLWENALRRDELCSLNHEHLFLNNRQISVKAKGKGNTRQLIDISDSITNTLQTWLTRSQDVFRIKDDFGVAPVFIALDYTFAVFALQQQVIILIAQEAELRDFEQNKI